ncbi:hypothetical protein M8C21_033610, partial [Ambrosia artemisiifolia]
MVFCSCGKEAVKRTSWTNDNPRRLFYSCPDKTSSCPFFEWVDDPTCPRLGSIIRGLLNSKNRLENKATDLEDNLRKKKATIRYLSIV